MRSALAARLPAPNRDARIVAHLKARFPEVYELVAARVDAGVAEDIEAMDDDDAPLNRDQTARVLHFLGEEQRKAVP